jgi:hypothetical protein
MSGLLMARSGPRATALRNDCGPFDAKLRRLNTFSDMEERGRYHGWLVQR